MGQGGGTEAKAARRKGPLHPTWWALLALGLALEGHSLLGRLRADAAPRYRWMAAGFFVFVLYHAARSTRRGLREADAQQHLPDPRSRP